MNTASISLLNTGIYSLSIEGHNSLSPSNVVTLEIEYTIWPDCNIATVSAPANQLFNNDMYQSSQIKAGEAYDAADHIGLAIGFDKDYPIDDFTVSSPYGCNLEY